MKRGCHLGILFDLDGLSINAYQPSAIAPVGQEASQAPHATQTSASMLYCVSPWEIAPTKFPPWFLDVNDILPMNRKNGKFFSVIFAIW